MKHSFHLLTLVALSLLIGCTKEGTTKLKEVDDVCTMMDDMTFMKYCYENYDINRDHVVSMSEAHAVKSINVSSLGILSMKGLEFFDELTQLDCKSNKLSSLDVSHNIKLTVLYCDHNELTALDVSKNKELKELSCASNQLSSLNISKNTQLNTLRCTDNNLSSLNVSNNTEIVDLFCNFNQLSSLDISRLTQLNTFFISNNHLSSLDVSHNTLLNHLRCGYNQITSLDLSNNHELITLVFDSNRISSIDLLGCPNANRSTHYFAPQNDGLTITITDRKDYWYTLPTENETSNNKIHWNWQ